MPKHFHEGCLMHMRLLATQIFARCLYNDFTVKA